jgi:Protein of unknown function (DUF3311)
VSEEEFGTELAGENKANMKKTTPAALLLACVPFVAVCFSVPLWDCVYPMVFGLPFNIFWLMVWMPLTSVCLSCAYRLRSRRQGRMLNDREGDAE